MLDNCTPESLFEELENQTTSYTIRSYVCEGCNRDWSEIVLRKDKFKVKCPACKTKTLEQIIFDTPMCFVQQEATTLGQLAERNTKKMSSDEYAEKMDHHTKQGKKGRKQLGIKEPAKKWWGDGPSDLSNYTTKQQADYIAKGHK